MYSNCVKKGVGPEVGMAPQKFSALFACLTLSPLTYKKLSTPLITLDLRLMAKKELYRDDPKYKSSLECAETEDPQEASLNVESVNQS